MDKHSKLSTNILIFSTVVALILYITYSTSEKKHRSFNVESNPLINTNDAILALASFDNNILEVAKSDTVLNDEENNENLEIFSVVEEIKELEETKDNSINDKEVAEKPKEPANQEKREHVEVVSRGASIAESRMQKDVNLNGTLNRYVLDVIKSYKIGNFPYLLNNDYQNYNGVTENIYYQGELLLKANPNGNRASHCTGITFEVFFKAMQNRNRDLGIDINNFNGMSKNELYDFALTWYVANGPKSISNMAVAMERYGVGKRIYDLEELRSGDFIDFSRENNTGHTAVFISWIREGNRIIGFKYWSSQGSTNGINYNEEYFNIKRADGSKYGNVIIDNLYMGRINPISEYKSFR